MGSAPGLERTPGEGNGNLLQYSCLENLRTEEPEEYSPWGHKELDAENESEGGFLGGSDGQESACNAGDLGSIPGSERTPGEGNGNPLQYSFLEHPMDRGLLHLCSSVILACSFLFL